MKFSDLRNTLSESKQFDKEIIPAAMLVLRRRGIRIFPDGRKVAMYTNDQYGMVFTIPFNEIGEYSAPISGVSR